MSIGEKLRAARHYKMWTQKKLAEESGLSLNSIRSYEIDKTTPSRADMVKLYAVLGDQFLNGLSSTGIDIPSVARDHSPPSDTAGIRTSAESCSILLAAFDLLNSEGQDEAIRQIMALTQRQEYKKDYRKSAQNSRENFLASTYISPERYRMRKDRCKQKIASAKRKITRFKKRVQNASADQSDSAEAEIAEAAAAALSEFPPDAEALLNKELKACEDELCALNVRFRLTLNLLDDDVQRDILTLKYLNDMEYFEIGPVLGYSVSDFRKIHDLAVEELNRKISQLCPDR